MRAVRPVFWAQLRHRWQAWLAIAVLISRWWPRHGRRRRRPAHGVSLPNLRGGQGLRCRAVLPSACAQISRLPGVVAVTEAFGPDNGQPTCACTHPLNPSSFGVLALPAQRNWISISCLALATIHPTPTKWSPLIPWKKTRGSTSGSVIRVPFYAPSQLSAANNATELHPSHRVRRSLYEWWGSRPPNSISLPAQLPSTASTPLSLCPRGAATHGDRLRIPRPPPSRRHRPSPIRRGHQRRRWDRLHAK